MTKKSKILIYLLLVLLILILYLILTSESIKRQPAESEPQAENVEISRLEDDYKTSAAALFFQYKKLIRENVFTAEKIAELKNKLLDLKVPAKFKDVHIRFVMSLTRLENYLNSADEQEKSQSLREVNQLEADYSWLNN